MNRLITAAAVGLCAGAASAEPDVICGLLTSVNSYGVVGGMRAYSIGTTACNKGTTAANWIANTINHPVISTTLYKIEDGRMTQLGVSFVKHSWAALQGNDCGFGCGPGGSWQALGPGCSDPYSAGLNGTQTDLGPRFEINAFTGEFPWPPSFINQTGNNVFKRLQVPADDMVTNANGQFFAEGQYTARDDALAGNQFNNTSYRRMVVNQGNFSMSGTGATEREIPAIYAWRDHGLGQNQPDPSVTITQIDVPGEGRFHLASKAVDLGNGTWRYEYGLHNQNSHRSAGSISIPVNTGSDAYGFHGISYHSGEPISDAAWTPSDDGSKLTWSTESFAVNQNANAVRWATMYNFWFETDSPPTTGDVEIGLFRPGSPSALTASATVPTGSAPCLADFNGDENVNFFDVADFIGAFNAQDASADIAEPFGSFNFFDVSAFIAAYNVGCP
jgi:hypothetical protein